MEVFTNKVAVYGFINQNLGGLCSGHYLAFEQLCRLGYDLTFLESPGWIEAGNLALYSNVDVIALEVKSSKLESILLSIVKGWENKTVVQKIVSSMVHSYGWKKTGKKINEVLARKGIKTVVFAGFLCPWKFKNINVISWTQGPIFGEADWILKHPKLSLKHFGFISYILTCLAYVWKTGKEYLNINKSQVILCGSEWAKSHWLAWGCKPEKLKVLPYAYAKKNVRLWNLGEKVNNSFLHLGRLVPRKRIELLIDAFSDSKLSGCKLTIVGHFVFPKASFLVESLPSNITYLPQISFSEVGRLFSENKFLIQVSENENLGSSVMEAMSQGVPVILNRQNGTADYVPNEGWHFFERYEKDDLIAAILRAIESTGEMDCDWKAVENHKELFSPEVVGAKLSAIISEQLASSSKRTSTE